MTVKVRSSAGNKQMNDATPNFDSPATITAGDLLALLIMLNDDTSVTLGVDTGWKLEDTEITSSSPNTSYFLCTKTATADDSTNAGTANQYLFSGFNGSDDILYGLFSFYDDAGGTVSYKGSSLASTYESDSDADTDAPTQTIAADGSLSLSFFRAGAGVNNWKIHSGSQAYAPTGGANPTYHNFGWARESIAGANIVAVTAEWDISDSPIGAQQITHQDLDADTNTFSCSAIFEATSVTGGAVFTEQTVTLTNSTTNVCSVFAKADTMTWIKLSMETFGIVEEDVLLVVPVIFSG